MSLSVFSSDADEQSKRIALLPLDSRPACTQMPQMMAAIAGVEVALPPSDLLGAFETPGKCEELASWLKDAAKTASALIVSAEMLCYGGLVQSRANDVADHTALRRVGVLRKIREQSPSTPIYVASAIMRTAPTATPASASWRMELARFLYYRDMARVTGSKTAAAKAEEHRANVPTGELERYERIRERNVRVKRELVALLKEGVIDYLVFGQDDAEPYGPHRAERNMLRSLLQREGVSGRAMICGGIDQTACVLLARALARSRGLTPRVYVEWSGNRGKRFVAPNEGQSTEQSVSDQIFATGCRPARSKEDADIVLWLNSYGRTEEEFEAFKEALVEDVSQGRVVALADVNLDASGAADPALVRFLLESRLCTSLAGYAGWNTVSNTLGTSLPQAVLYWLALRDPSQDACRRELARVHFTLQRLTSDYGYNMYIRPQAYRYLTEELKGRKEQVDGQNLELLNRFVAKHTEKVLRTFFKMGFQGTKLSVCGGLEAQTLYDVADVRISLPWPRAYEVRVDFGIITTPSLSGNDADGEPPLESSGEEDGTETPS